MLFLTVFGGSEEIIALYYAISLRMVVLNYGGEVEEWSGFVGISGAYVLMGRELIEEVSPSSGQR